VNTPIPIDSDVLNNSNFVNLNNVNTPIPIDSESLNSVNTPIRIDSDVLNYENTPFLINSDNSKFVKNVCNPFKSVDLDTDFTDNIFEFSGFINSNHHLYAFENVCTNPNLSTEPTDKIVHKHSLNYFRNLSYDICTSYYKFKKPILPYNSTELEFLDLSFDYNFFNSVNKRALKNLKFCSLKNLDNLMFENKFVGKIWLPFSPIKNNIISSFISSKKTEKKFSVNDLLNILEYVPIENLNEGMIAPLTDLSEGIVTRSKFKSKQV
jgi:hypothetical protein